MKNKSETRNLLMSFVAFVQNQFGKYIKVIRSDNGQEFHWKEFYDKHDIIHQTTCIETPQQNFVVERKHQHILNVIRSLISQSKIPKVFWNYAISHFVYLINRLPCHIIQNKSPYEMLYKLCLILIIYAFLAAYALHILLKIIEINWILDPRNASF